MKVGRSLDGTIFSVSRRRLLTGLGAPSGLLLAPGFPKTAFALKDDEEGCGGHGLCEVPHPIPHVNKFLLTTFGVKGHFFFPGPVEGTPAATDKEVSEPGGRDPSTIYNFKGFIGQADLSLTGTGTDLNSGMSQKYSFHTDSRFMTGVFVGTDGQEHRGAFAEV